MLLFFSNAVRMCMHLTNAHKRMYDLSFTFFLSSPIEIFVGVFIYGNTMKCKWSIHKLFGADTSMLCAHHFSTKGLSWESIYNQNMSPWKMSHLVKNSNKEPDYGII